MSSRRKFLISTSAAAATQLSPVKAAASDRVRVAILGVNGRGKDHMSGLVKQPDVDIAMFCDPDGALLEKRAGEFEVLGDGLEGVVTAGCVHAASRVGGGAAQVQPRDLGSVV